MKIGFKKFGLRLKFIITFSLLILLTSVLLSIFLIRKQAELIRNELNEKGEYLVKNLASSSEYGVLVEDTKLLTWLLQGILEDKDICYIMIQDKDRKILASQDKGVLLRLSSKQKETLTNIASQQEGLNKQNFVLKKTREEFYDFSFPVTTFKTVKFDEEVSLGLATKTKDGQRSGVTERIGTARVGITTAEMAERIAEMKRIVIFVTFQIVLLGIFLAFLMVRIIMNPLERLVQATKKVAVGDFSLEVKIRQKDELGELANSFNIMTRNLRKLICEIEEYNRTLEKKVEERTKKLEEAQAFLVQSEKLSAIGQLISGVAHELNNPLASVIGFSQLALGSEVNTKTGSYLKKICSEADRCAKIVNNLLTFSRRSKPEKKSVGVNGIVERTLDLMSYQLQVNNIRITKDLDAGLPKTLGDFHQLQQVFLNIVNNAFQAMTEKAKEGIITVRTKRIENIILIEFTDTGPGIAKENLNRIFDPFFTTKDIGKGTGLGLSISYGIIKEHGGNIYALSEPGKGATFVIELPIVETPLTVEVTEKTSKEITPSFKAYILVIDDEENILDLLYDFLKGKGYYVDTASTGQEALRKFKTEMYDLIICDLKMPNLSGQQLYNEIKKIKPELSSRIVFFTGDTVSPQTESFLKSTRNRVISKPFDLNWLLSFIQEFLTSQTELKAK
jgi:signal transduction histidine kinase/ActR/RegA family two-component response regulator